MSSAFLLLVVSYRLPRNDGSGPRHHSTAVGSGPSVCLLLQTWQRQQLTQVRCFKLAPFNASPFAC